MTKYPTQGGKFEFAGQASENSNFPPWLGCLVIWGDSCQWKKAPFGLLHGQLLGLREVNMGTPTTFQNISPWWTFWGVGHLSQTSGSLDIDSGSMLRFEKNIELTNRAPIQSLSEIFHQKFPENIFQKDTSTNCPKQTTYILHEEFGKFFGKFLGKWLNWGPVC